ncbi:branched-chain amino acid ABC transporter permease [Pseudonocardia sp. GCM10023141]|uniref:branched-chain amino acid ABC transporter permease n=1 Tax=Pseudonocardia sp. GCM10023141 TaxID=3252653 RepID=UPI00362312F5
MTSTTGAAVAPDTGSPGVRERLRPLGVGPAGWGVGAVVVTLVLVGGLPYVLNAYAIFVLTQVAIYSIACLGLTVVIGWSGQVALAQAGFFGVGAYGASYLFNHGVPWVLATLTAALFAAAVGVAIGLPAARLKGFYLAIATLAFGDLMGQVFNEATAVTGGPNGMAVEPLRLGSLPANVGLWYLCAVLLGACLLVLGHIGRTRWGRCVRAVRDIEIATGALGLSAVKYKVQAFAVSGFLGALAGSLFGQSLTYVSPEAFNSTLVISFLIVVLVGGADRIVGAVAGAAFLVVTQELLQSVGAFQRLVFGLALVAVVRFVPNGVVPWIAEWLRGRSRHRRGSAARPGASTSGSAT